MDLPNYVAEYYEKIKNDKKTVGKLVRACYKMLMDGYANGDFYFDAKKALKPIVFIETFCHHTKGRHDLIKLELWQKAGISAIYGTVDENGIRFFREVLWVMGRKNGKSTEASGLTNYTAYADGEYGADIYCLAPKLDQANIVFGDFCEMVQNEPELASLARKRRTDIYIEATNTTIKPIAFNAKKSDGLNPHLTICDEIAAWRGDAGLKQYEVMKSALGARRQPLIIALTTAGYENDGIFDELIKRGTAVLKGRSEEKRLLPLIYMIDDPNKWDDLQELKKANPNMGVSVSEDYFIEEIAIARQSASKKAEFLTKYCNIKQNSSTAWLDYIDVSDALCDLTIEDFKDSYAVGGFDLSQTTDLTAACIIIERAGCLYCFAHFWMPEGRIEKREAEDGVPYRIFVQRGLLTLSPGNKVNYHQVYDWFVELVEKYHIYIVKVGYDRYSAQYLIDDMQAYGFQVDDVFQGENLTPVIKEFEGTLRDKKFKICGRNDLLAAHLLNVALQNNNQTRRVRPVKINSRARIDGSVSVLDGMTVRQKFYEEVGYLLKNEA